MHEPIADRADVHRSSLLWFLLLVVGGGLLIGYLSPPGSWYAQLEKPSFTPPGWIFPPVWTVLYVTIAIAGWRIHARQRGGWPMRLWWTQLALNFAWSPIFFVAHQAALALLVVRLLFVAVVLLIAAAWRVDRVSAALLVPYAAWVAFASALNAGIVALNG